MNKKKVCINKRCKKKKTQCYSSSTKWPQVLTQKADGNSCLCLVVASGGLGGDKEKALIMPKREEGGGRVTEPLQRELKTWEESRRFEKRWRTGVK